MSASKFALLCKNPVTTIDSSAEYAVGTRRWEDGKEYVYVAASEEIGPQKAVKASKAYAATVAGSTSFVVGVSLSNTLTTGTYGFVQTRGVATLASATIAAGSKVEAGAAGVAVSGSTNPFGDCLEVASGSTAVSVYIR